MNGEEVDELSKRLGALVTELSSLVEELHSFPVTRMFYQKVQFWAALFSALTFCLGGSLAFGGLQRVSGNAYWVVNNYGGHELWGGAYMAAATFTTLCCWKAHRWLRISLLIQALAFAFIAISFFVAAARFPTANLTATPVYGWIMVMHVFLSDFARREFNGHRRFG